MMQALTRHISPGWLLVAPFFLVVVAFYLGPLANILWLSVTEPEPGLGNYEKLVENDALARILWTTFRTCAITTVFSVAIGYCLAYAMVHAHQKNQNIMLTLLLISFWISVLVRTFAWLMLLGHNGLVNNGMEAIGLIDRPVRFMRNELGVLIGMVHYMVPYAVLPLIIPQIISAMVFYRLLVPMGLIDSYPGLILAHTVLATRLVLITVSASLANFDPKLEQASRNLGAPAWVTMRRVILPSIKPGVVAGADPW